MDRQIVCFAVPTPSIALARLTDPALRQRPLAIASLPTPRALLHEISREAATEGIQTGIPIEHALRLCPSLRVLPPNPQILHKAERDLLQVIARYAPVWEPTAPGAYLLDLTGTARLFGPTCDTAARIQREIAQRYYLEGVVGVGSNKLIARTASTLVAPSQLYDVRPGSERAFMAPLPIRALPVLTRPRMHQIRERLDDLNLQTFGDIAASAFHALELAVGEWAGQLSRWSCGIDPTPVLPPPAQPELEESVMLEPDEVDDGRLLGRLANLLERLCRTLRQQRRVCHGLTLTLRYSDHIEATKHQLVRPGTCWEVDLTPPLVSLFQRCFRRRVRIRLLTLGVTGLTGLAEQMSLFDEGSALDQQRARAQRLAVAVDRLRGRFDERELPGQLLSAH